MKVIKMSGLGILVPFKTSNLNSQKWGRKVIHFCMSFIGSLTVLKGVIRSWHDC